MRNLKIDSQKKYEELVSRVKNLHAVYVRATGLDVRMDMMVEAAWVQWLDWSKEHYGEEWTWKDLANTLAFIKREAQEGKWPGIARFRYLINDPESFCESWLIMRAQSRQRRDDSGRTAVLREAKMVDPKTHHENVKTVAAMMAAFRKEQGWDNEKSDKSGTSDGSNQPGSEQLR